jgi:DNA (cytosine-5)-methyltransferase 1
MEKTKIKVLDLFSGIGGFHLGLTKAGFEVESYFSEIDKYAIDVYSNNFKNATYVGSVTDVCGGDLPNIDAITFGSPCQDFSLAGKRQGLGGDRSSLISEAIRLIRETRPRFFIWENVKGTFSSNSGEDFAAILQAFANIGGYRLEWQLLNTKWFLPQNRERIYLVGYLGNGSGGQVFPIREGKRSSDELQRQQGSACTVLARYEAGANGSYVVERKLDAQEVKILGYSRDSKGVVVNYHEKDECNTLHSASGGGGNTDQFIKQNKIRRLTPVECERLQGFSDNWTKYGTKGEISDSQRYKMCGNAVTVDVVAEVAKNIKEVVYGKTKE